MHFVAVNEWDEQLPGPLSITGAALDGYLAALDAEWQRRSHLPWTQDLARFVGG